MIYKRRSNYVFFICLFALTSPLTAQTQTSQTQEAPGLTTLTVTVRNKTGNFIMGVSPDRFQLWDEKDERPIQFFENADTPMSIGILVDTSESVQAYEVKQLGRQEAIAEAIGRLLELSNPQNEYFLAGFDRTARTITDWTNDKTVLSNVSKLRSANKQTAFFDACLDAVGKFQTAHYSKRALIVFTDGQDNSSHRTFKNLREGLKHSDVVLHAIGVGPWTEMESLGMESRGILLELSELTGGVPLFPPDLKKLQASVEFLAIELRNQYQIGFKPAAGVPGKWRRIQVVIKPVPNPLEEFNNLTVRARTGYYSR